MQEHLGQYGKQFGIQSGGGNTRKFYRLQMSAEQIDIINLPPQSIRSGSPQYGGAA